MYVYIAAQDALFSVFFSPKEREKERTAAAGNMMQFERDKEEGNELYKQGLYRDAIGCYDRLIAAQPQNPVGHSNKAMALIKLGEHAQAIEACQQGLQLAASPQHAALRAKLLYRLQLAQAAVAPLRIPVVEVDELPAGFDRS